MFLWCSQMEHINSDVCYGGFHEHMSHAGASGHQDLHQGHIMMSMCVFSSSNPLPLAVWLIGMLLLVETIIIIVFLFMKIPI